MIVFGKKEMSIYENSEGDVKLTTGNTFLFVQVNQLQEFYLGTNMSCGQVNSVLCFQMTLI